MAAPSIFAAMILLLLAALSAGQIIDELNRVRANPAAYVRALEQRRVHYRGKLYAPAGETPLMTNEGVAPLNEAIAVLKKTRPLPLVRLSGALTKAAESHVRDIGPKGLTSHEGSNGRTSTQRIQTVAPRAMHFGEVMTFGAPDVIAELLIDDGVPNRGHRKILLDPDYLVAGAACGPHKEFGTVCVIDLADTAP